MLLFVPGETSPRKSNRGHEKGTHSVRLREAKEVSPQRLNPTQIVQDHRSIQRRNTKKKPIKHKWYLDFSSSSLA
jgi:hypothetical protein